MGGDRSIVIVILDFVVWVLGLLFLAVTSAASVAVAQGVLAELPSWSSPVMDVYANVQSAVAGFYTAGIESAEAWHVDAGILAVSLIGLIVRWFGGFLASVGVVVILAVGAYFAIPAILG